MSKLRRVPGWAAGLVAVALAGCSTGTAAPTSSAGSPASLSASDAAPSASSEGPASGGAPWLAEPLTDVRTGLRVRLGDFAGHVVFVEGMATWCPPCLEQQHEAANALSQLAGSTVVYVSVDIDPREPAATLGDYVARNHFGWQFLVASPAFLRELADAFGATILSPPATPIVVVDATGHATLTEIGIKRAARLVELARALGA